MFLDMKVSDGDYEGLQKELENAGFRKSDTGRQKWNENNGATTVYVLTPQERVEIYFGSMGRTERVDPKSLTPEAREALSIAMKYMKCESVVDHTGKEVDYLALLK